MKQQKTARNSLQLIITSPIRIGTVLIIFLVYFFIRIESGTCVFDIQSVNGKKQQMVQNSLQ